MLALSKAVIGMKLTAKAGEITISHRGKPMDATNTLITVVKDRAWRWKLELYGSSGEMEVITGKIYLDDLRLVVKSWEEELSPDGAGLSWVATVVGV